MKEIGLKFFNNNRHNFINFCRDGMLRATIYKSISLSSLGVRNMEKRNIKLLKKR